MTSTNIFKRTIVILDCCLLELFELIGGFLTELCLTCALTIDNMIYTKSAQPFANRIIPTVSTLAQGI